MSGSTTTRKGKKPTSSNVDGPRTAAKVAILRRGRKGKGRVGRMSKGRLEDMTAKLDSEHRNAQLQTILATEADRISGTSSTVLKPSEVPTVPTIQDLAEVLHAL